MASEEAKDPWKGEEWVTSDNQNQKKKEKSSGGVKTATTRARKQIPRGLEEKYEAYFLPRKPWPKALAFLWKFHTWWDRCRYAFRDLDQQKSQRRRRCHLGIRQV
ncbi:unnamed protein product, partial [Cochlearia groenlandica]